jgi:hypothetical protein
MFSEMAEVVEKSADVDVISSGYDRVVVACTNGGYCTVHVPNIQREFTLIFGAKFLREGGYVVDIIKKTCTALLESYYSFSGGAF